jgi:hypothetical protein
VEAADYDSDGDVDLYVGSYDQASSTYKHWLFNNEMSRFKDVSEEAGLKHSGKNHLQHLLIMTMMDFSIFI